MLRPVVKSMLRAAGLLEPIRQARALGVSRLAREARYWLLGAPDGLPIPPARLRGLIVAQASTTIHDYLRFGQYCADAVTGLLGAQSVSLTAAAPLLDFGCGCGRVMRRLWAAAPGLPIYGSDLNAEQVAWSGAALPFAGLTVNQPTPPLSFPDGQFGLVYAFSVFTHVPAAWQRSWLAELVRVARPGGYLLLSLHGAAHMAAHGTPADRARFDRGDLVVRVRPHAPDDASYTAEGDAGCDVYHPPAYVRDTFARGLEVVTHVPGRVMDPERQVIAQDLWLLRAPGTT